MASMDFQAASYYPKTGVCYEHEEASKIYLIYTFKCNASCDHCLVQSRPRRTEKLSVDEAKTILDLGVEFGKSFLTLSGGEPMLYPREVLEVVAHARARGYYVCLNTNGFWAKTPERAVEILAELQAAGVRAVFPTISAYHEQYVPPERVRHVRDAARMLGVEYELNFFDSHDPETDARLKKMMEIEDEVYFFDGLTDTGNDEGTMETLRGVYRRRTPDELDDCLSVHLGVNPHGHVVASCNMTYDNRKFAGTPFFLGNFKEEGFLAMLAREHESPALNFLYRRPHPALHNLLRLDPVVGDYYVSAFSQRRYFTVVDFYIDVFTDARLSRRLDTLLPEQTDALLAATG